MLKGKIGFEIEGFIPQEKEEALRQFCNSHNIDFETDRSVGFSFSYTENRGTQQEHTKSERAKRENKSCRSCNAFELHGEGLVFDIKDIKQAIDLIEEIFKIGIRVNSSCGLHIHLSLKHIGDYYRLLNYDFVQDFQNKIQDILKTSYEKKRLIAYFSKQYTTQEEFLKVTNNQLCDYGKSSSRYYTINFNSFNLHKTIEFRIFPATNNITRFKKYLNFLLDIAEEHISKNKGFELQEEFNLNAKMKRQNRNRNIIVKIPIKASEGLRCAT